MSQTKAQLIDPVDGTIVNADINASAAIAGSKISPAFTSNITGTGDLTLSSGGSDRLKMTHAGGGQFVIKNPSAAALSFGTNNQNNELHISNGGNVGIGAAGSVALHIHNASPTIRLTDTDNSRFSQIYAVDGNLRFDADNNNEQGSTHIAFRTDNSERMRIDSSGRLMLGTTSVTAVPIATTNRNPQAEIVGSLSGSNHHGSLSLRCTNDSANLYLGSALTSGTRTAGSVVFLLNDGTDYHAGGRIDCANDDTTANNDTPGRLVFFTTADGASSPTERMRINSAGNVLVGTTSDSIFNDTSGGGFNLKAGGQLVLAKQATSAADPLVWLNDTGQTTNKSIVFAQDGSEKANIGLAGNDATITVNGSERLRIDSSGRLMIGTTTAVGTNTPVLQVKAASPASGFDNHIYLEGSETNGNANTGATIGFGGHDGTTARNWAQIAGFKTNGSSGNTSSFLSFRTRRSGVSGINEMWKITAMGSLLARDSKESAIGREYTNGSVAAGETVNFDGSGGANTNSRLNFNSIGGNGGGHLTCVSIASFDQNPSGAMIVVGVHGQGFNSYDTLLSNFDSGISVTFNSTLQIANTSSETIYYSINVIHMGTGNTTYLGR